MNVYLAQSLNATTVNLIIPNAKPVFSVLELTWSVNAQDVLPLDVRIVQPISFIVVNVLQNTSIEMENVINAPNYVSLVPLQLIARNAVILVSIPKMEYALGVPVDARNVILKLIAHNAALNIILMAEDVNETLICVSCSLEEFVSNATQDISFRMGYV